VLDQALEQFGVFGFKEFEMVGERSATRATRPSTWANAQWTNAENDIKAALDSRGVQYIVAEGEAKFYGRPSTS